MRMWNVPTNIMCRQHLLGEHSETHMFLGAIKRGTSLLGYINSNLFDMATLKERHEDLVKEMEDRGMLHLSPLEDITGPSTPINKELSLEDLLGRCENCKGRYEDALKGK